MSYIAEDEWKGKPVLIIKERLESRYAWAFGLKKAFMVIEHIAFIRDFVEKHYGPEVWIKEGIDDAKGKTGRPPRKMPDVSEG